MLKDLEGRVVLIAGAGDGIGRAAALALSARGASLVVFGPNERTLGETVGEVVYGGGKARHVVGDPSQPADAASAVTRAHEVFGHLDTVIAVPSAGLAEVLGTFHAALPTLKEGDARLLVLARPADREGLDALVGALAVEGAARGITCHGILSREGLTGRAAIEEEEKAASLVVRLCTQTAAATNGQVLRVEHEASDTKGEGSRGGA